MNLKNSNKYLFNQSIKCRNCKYYNSHLNWDDCLRFDRVSGGPHGEYRVLFTESQILDFMGDTTLFYTTNYARGKDTLCGPIGLYYEPKE